MFVAFPLSRAAVGDSVGDVSHNSGFCVQTAGSAADSTDADEYTVRTTWDTGYSATADNTVAATDAVMVYHPDDTNDQDSNEEGTQGDADNKPDAVVLTCAASQKGLPVKITPNGTITPIIEALAPSVSIALGDSDGMVKADSELSVKVNLANFVSGSTDVANAPQIVWVRVSGVLDGTEVGTTGSGVDEAITVPTANDAGTGAVTGKASVDVPNIIIPDGTPVGDYTVSVEVHYDRSDAAETPTNTVIGSDGKEKIRASKTFTVTDTGMNAASATLSLGNEREDLPATTPNERKPETGTTPANGDIWLKVEVMNSLGEKSNSNGLNTITVIAPGAVLAFHAPTASGAPATDPLAAGSPGVGALSGGTNSISISDDTDAATADVVGQTMFVKVTKAGTPPKAGSIKVYALVIGSDGAPRTNDVDLHFTGSASVVVLGDDVSVGKPAEGEESKAEISLINNDASGNKAALGTVLYKVTDADGEAVSQSKVKAETSTKGSSTDKTTDDDANVDVVLVTVDDSADPGVYTIEASLSGVDDSSDTATVTVSGAAANIELEASSDPDPVELGSVVTVTATVTDKDGNTVADKTQVDFATGGALELKAVGKVEDVETKDGVAKARFIASKGSGLAVIIVDSGAASESTHVSTADAPVVVEADPALASVSIEVVGEDHSAGRITVLASLADADGEPVEGMVSFYHSGDATLFGPKDVVTSDGTATAEYDANDDITVLAVSGSHRASVRIAVTSVAEQAAADQAEADRIAQEEADAQAERDRIAAEEQAEADRIAQEEADAAAAADAAELAAEVERLSGMTGFASWLSEQTISASELFSALSEDGATAIHVWNGSSWVRYSVVDGNEVPGSVDFMVSLGNVLYISN